MGSELVRYIPEAVVLDEVQKMIADSLDVRAIELEEDGLFDQISKKFLSFFSGTQRGNNSSFSGTQQRNNRFFSSTQKGSNIAGIYLHGNVGRGKTMLMQAFFQRLRVKKEMVHYQNFMQGVHKKMHNLQECSADRVVEDLASDIAGRTRVLCIDEFEVRDITDAMLIMRIFTFLITKGVFIMVTTNTVPDDLYKDGLQRELFFPFIKMVKERFDVFFLDSHKDYRFDKISSIVERVFAPIDATVRKKLDLVKQDLTDGMQPVPRLLEVFGRKVEFRKTHRDCLFVSFAEIIDHDFGYSDYVNICQQFSIIVLEGVPEIAEEENNRITRFINFIDNAYFYKVLLFISLEKKIEEIYKKGRKIDEYQRTISRLVEMNSSSYLHAAEDEYRSK